jgi:hypothetical protein
MQERIAPREKKAQELRAMWQGQSEAQSGEELLSPLVRLSTERVRQEVLEQEQAEAWGRGRYARRDGTSGALRTARSRRPKGCCGCRCRRSGVGKSPSGPNSGAKWRAPVRCSSG